MPKFDFSNFTAHRPSRGPRRPRLTEKRAEALGYAVGHLEAVSADFEMEAEAGARDPEDARQMADAIEYLNKLVAWKRAQS